MNSHQNYIGSVSSLSKTDTRVLSPNSKGGVCVLNLCNSEHFAKFSTYISSSNYGFQFVLVVWSIEYLIFYGPLQFFAKVNEIYPLFIASNQLCKANVDIRIMAILLINIIMLILYNCIQGYYSALSVTSDKRNQD